jgi:hypothetical protein
VQDEGANEHPTASDHCKEIALTLSVEDAFGDAVTVGDLDVIIVVVKGKLVKCEQEHTSTTEYEIACPRVIELSIQFGVFREDEEQALDVMNGADEPVTLVTLHDEKLQYELEHALAPAVHDTIMEVGRLDDDDNVKDDGVLATTNALDDADALLPVGQVQPSTTLKMYALLGTTFCNTQ